LEVFQYFHTYEKAKSINKSLASSTVMLCTYTTDRQATDDTYPILFEKLPMGLELFELSHQSV